MNATSNQISEFYVMRRQQLKCSDCTLSLILILTSPHPAQQQICTAREGEWAKITRITVFFFHDNAVLEFENLFRIYLLCDFSEYYSLDGQFMGMQNSMWTIIIILSWTYAECLIVKFSCDNEVFLPDTNHGWKFIRLLPYYNVRTYWLWAQMPSAIFLIGQKANGWKKVISSEMEATYDTHQAPRLRLDNRLLTHVIISWYLRFFARLRISRQNMTDAARFFHFLDTYPVVPVYVFATHTFACLLIPCLLYFAQIAPLHNNCRWS